MDLLVCGAPLDNSFQKDRLELVNKGSLSRRRRPSRSNLKNLLSPSNHTPQASKPKSSTFSEKSVVNGFAYKERNGPQSFKPPLRIESSLPRTSPEPNYVADAQQFSIQAKLKRKKSDAGRSAVLIQTWERRTSLTKQSAKATARQSTTNRFQNKENLQNSTMPDFNACPKYAGKPQNGESLEKGGLVSRVRDAYCNDKMVYQMAENVPRYVNQISANGHERITNSQEPEWISLSRKLCAKFVEGHIEHNSSDSYLHEEPDGVKQQQQLSKRILPQQTILEPPSKVVKKKVVDMTLQTDPLSKEPPWIHLSRKLCTKFIEEHIEYPVAPDDKTVKESLAIEPNGDLRIIEKIGAPKGRKSKIRKDSEPEWVSLSRKLRAKFIESHIDDPDTISLDNQLNASDPEETSSESLSDTSQEVVIPKKVYEIPNPQGHKDGFQRNGNTVKDSDTHKNRFQSSNHIPTLFPEKECCWEYQEMEFDQESSYETSQEPEFFQEPVSDSMKTTSFSNTASKSVSNLEKREKQSPRINCTNFTSFAETVNSQLFQNAECYNNDVQFAPHEANVKNGCNILESEKKVITVQFVSHPERISRDKSKHLLQSDHHSEKDNNPCTFFNLTTWEEAHYKADKVDPERNSNSSNVSLRKAIRSKSMDNICDSESNNCNLNEDSNLERSQKHLHHINNVLPSKVNPIYKSEDILDKLECKSYTQNVQKSSNSLEKNPKSYEVQENDVSRTGNALKLRESSESFEAYSDSDDYEPRGRKSESHRNNAFVNNGVSKHRGQKSENHRNETSVNGDDVHRFQGRKLDDHRNETSVNGDAYGPRGRKSYNCKNEVYVNGDAYEPRGRNSENYETTENGISVNCDVVRRSLEIPETIKIDTSKLNSYSAHGKISGNSKMSEACGDYITQNDGSEKFDSGRNKELVDSYAHKPRGKSSESSETSENENSLSSGSDRKIESQFYEIYKVEMDKNYEDHKSQEKRLGRCVDLEKDDPRVSCQEYANTSRQNSNSKEIPKQVDILKSSAEIRQCINNKKNDQLNTGMKKHYKCNGFIPNSKEIKSNKTSKTREPVKEEPTSNPHLSQNQRPVNCNRMSISSSEKAACTNEYANITPPFIKEDKNSYSDSTSKMGKKSKSVHSVFHEVSDNEVHSVQKANQSTSRRDSSSESSSELNSNFPFKRSSEMYDSNYPENYVSPESISMKIKSKSLHDISKNENFYEYSDELESDKRPTLNGCGSGIMRSKNTSNMKFQEFECESDIPLCAKLVSKQNGNRSTRSESSSSNRNASPCSESSHVYEDMFKETTSCPSDSETSSWTVMKKNSYCVNGRSSSMNDLDFSDSCSLSVKCDYASSASEQSTLQSRHSSCTSSSFYVNLRDYDSHMLEPSLNRKKKDYKKVQSKGNSTKLTNSNPPTPESLRHLFTSPFNSIHSPVNRNARLLTGTPQEPESHYYSTAAAASSAFKHGFDPTPPKPKKTERSSSIKIKDIAHGIILTFRRFQNHSKSSHVSPTHYVDVSHLAEFGSKTNISESGKPKSKKEQKDMLKKQDDKKRWGFSSENSRTDSDSGCHLPPSDVQRAKARRSSSDLTGIRPNLEIPNGDIMQSRNGCALEKKKSKSGKKNSNAQEKGKKTRSKSVEPKAVSTVSRKVQQMADGTLYLVTTVSGDTALPGVYSDSPDTSSELSSHKPVKLTGESNC